MNYPCPCCGHLTLDAAPEGTFAICPVCYWEDDNIQNDDPTYEGGANSLSLNEAKVNFSQYGAIKKEFIQAVRAPLPEEFPAHHTRVARSR